MTDLNKLNPMQKEAVLSTEGPLLILAGAGSGKTRVLTYRIAHLIDMGVPPYAILAITFTNKAAKEMLERVNGLTPDAEGAWISTFHSCCAKILRRDIDKLGYSRSFVIYDDDDSTTLVKNICKTMNLSDKIYPPRTIRYTISDAKNKLLSPDDWFSETDGTKEDRTCKLVYEQYEAHLKANNALDFDDLLLKTLELMAACPPVLEAYRNRFRYILVDEYQDTNLAQYRLIELLGGIHKNVCVVGDDDQSIYGWRGADIRNILNFEKDFPGCKVIKLEQNYRSTGTILDAANNVIAHNSERKGKSLWTEAEEGDRIRLYHALDERDEAAFIADTVSHAMRGGIGYGQNAVLYRTNAQSRVIEETFTNRGIPYRVYGGLRFYDRKEVKDLIAYLRVLANPDDSISLRRIINEPKRSIGAATVDTLSTFAEENGYSLLSAVFYGADAGLSGRSAIAVSKFAELMLSLADKAISLPPDELLRAVLEETGYKHQYEQKPDEENESRLQNIQELENAVIEYTRQNPEGGLIGFLENVALVTDLDDMTDESGCVTMMTLHAAKGLEFPNVFLVGMEEGIFPIRRAMFDDIQMEEERRLAYVGITRAMKHLYLSHARSRMLYGEYQSARVSRFVDEIPRRLIDDGRVSRTQPVRMAAPARQPSAAPRSARPDALSSIAGVQKGFFGSAARNTAPAAIFEPGDRVYHRVFGQGTVKGYKESVSGKMILIEFDGSGVKQLSADTAPIIKVEL